MKCPNCDKNVEINVDSDMCDNCEVDAGEKAFNLRADKQEDNRNDKEYK